MKLLQAEYVGVNNHRGLMHTVNMREIDLPKVHFSSTHPGVKETIEFQSTVEF